MRRVVLDHMAASWFKTCFGFIPSCYLGWSLAQTCWMLQAPALMPGRGGSSSIIPVDSVSFCTKWLRRLWAKGSGDSTVCWLRRSPGGEAESSCASECWGFILFFFWSICFTRLYERKGWGNPVLKAVWLLLGPARRTGGRRGSKPDSLTHQAILPIRRVS